MLRTVKRTFGLGLAKLPSSSRRTLLSFLSLLFLALAVTSSADARELKWMSVHELNSRIESGQHFYIVDVRTSADYVESSIKIKGAKRIPLGRLEGALGRLPSGTDIILYTSDPSDTNAEAAAEILLDNGFSRDIVKVLRGGFTAWTYYDYPTELK